MNDVVVVIRTKDNDDLLAILTGKVDNQLKLDHPYYARVNPATNNVTMVPFCPLSDEIHFMMDVRETKFVVTASEDISRKFLSMVQASEPSPDQPDEDEAEETYIPSQIVSGNSTKH